MKDSKYALGVAQCGAKSKGQLAFEELVNSAFSVKFARENAMTDELVRFAYVGMDADGPLAFEALANAAFAVKFATERKTYEELARLARLDISVYHSRDEK